MLFWDAADGYNKGTFDVYRDGEKIGTAKHKKAAAFIWDTDFTPLVTEAIKTR